MSTNYPPQTTRLLHLLGITHPIVQAPMVGVSNPEMAAAVSCAGGLGSVGLAAGSAETINAAQSQLSALTNQPVNLNFFVHPTPSFDEAKELKWLNHLAPQFDALGAQPPTRLALPYGSFDDNPETLSALLQTNPKVVSFHFGQPAPATVNALKSSDCLVMGCATNPNEAQELETAGFDIIIAQGWEAGGHRGRFKDQTVDEQLGTMALVPAICQTVNVPVIAAGGINSGATAAAALKLGAAGVQLGTAFVTCDESSANATYRAALQDHRLQTTMTRVFSGRDARGIANTATAQLEHPTITPPAYPIAYDAGKALAAAAKGAGREQEFGFMWAGQAFRSNRRGSATELVELIITELHGALS